jgi:multimeric flavodoxin WrbA
VHEHDAGEGGGDVSVQDCANYPAPKSAVLGIGGSPRKNGNSDILLGHILNGVAETDTPFHKCQLRDYLYQGCIGCEKCRKANICTGLKDGMTLIYPHILESKGLVMVSPTHNYNVTSWVKAFIDRLYCFYDFDDQRPRGWSSLLADQGRKAVLAAVCEQAGKDDMGFTLDAMRRPLEALGYEIMAELPVFNVFDRAKVKEDPAILQKARDLGADLAGEITRAWA